MNGTSDTPSHPADPPPRTARPALRILVAEDNPINARLMRAVLVSLGHEPDVVGDGHEVLAALRRQRYEVIFMDVRMPGLDGIEATRRIRAQWPGPAGPRIIALTASDLSEERQACLEAGVDAFLVKPASREQLREALESPDGRAGRGDD